MQPELASACLMGGEHHGVERLRPLAHVDYDEAERRLPALLLAIRIRECRRDTSTGFVVFRTVVISLNANHHLRET